MAKNKRLQSTSNGTAKNYAIESMSVTLIEEIKEALGSINNYGSVEIYVQDGIVTQLTVRSIKKTINSKRKG